MRRLLWTLPVGLLFLGLSILAQADRSILVPGSVTGGAQTAPVVLHYLTTPYSGPLIQEDANTVAHVTFTNSGGNATLSDTKGNTWTLNGTVPSQTLTPFYPGGFAGSAKVGAGVFSASNHWSLAAGSPLAFSGNFTVCVGLDLTSLPTNFDSLVGVNDAGQTKGWGLYRNSLNVAQMSFFSGGTHVDALSGNQFSSGPNVICGGRNSSGVNVKLNGSSTVTVNTAYAQDSTDSAFFGGPDGIGTSAFVDGHMYEMYATTTAYSDTLAQAIENQILSQLTEQQLPLTVTRNSTATDTAPTGESTSCATPPCLFTWPTNVARVSSNGIVAEPSGTNLIQYSEQFDSAAWTKTNGVTVTANTTQAPDGNTTADTIQGAMAGGKVESSTTTAAAAVYAASVWVTGTNQSFDLRIRDTTAGSDLQACNGKTATGTLARFTCPSAGNATAGHLLAIDIYPGGGNGTGTIKAWGAQLEQHSFATGYIATTNAAASRSADQISASAPEGGLAAVGSLSSTVTFPSGLPAVQDIFLSLGSGSGVSTNVVEIQYSGSFQCSAYNSAGTLVQTTQAFTPTVGTAFPIKCSWDYLGAKQVCLSINNQAASCAALSGTGGSPTELDFGWSNRAGTAFMDTVGLKNVCLGNTAGACP